MLLAPAAGNIIPSVAIGFPAHYSKTITLPVSSETLADVVAAALQELRWPYRVEWGNEFYASPPHGGWSWGEDVVIKIEPGSQLHIKSKCHRFGQWFDLGTNKRNVKAFLAVIEKLSPRDPVSSGYSD